jgi:hypothetical protein
MNNQVYRFVARSNTITFNRVVTTDPNTDKTLLCNYYTFTFDTTVPVINAPLPNGGIGKGIFSSYEAYQGNVQPYWALPPTSNVFIQSANISIPNLRGIKHIQPLNGTAQNAEYQLSIATAPVGGGLTTFFTKTYTEFESSNPYEITAPPLTKKFWYLYPLNITVGIDARNLADVYNGISVFLQMEIDVICPKGVSFTGQ